MPFSLDAAAPVTDPVFGRDIGFFLFELPFLRVIQGLFNGLVVAALLLAAAQYLIGASRSGLVFTTPIRVHLAVLAGLFLLSVAFGYQLDKYELVYSTRGIATGVSFTDQNAQFFAFDVLTVMSGLAAALLVGGAFARVLWPLGFTIAIWFLASLDHRASLPGGGAAVLRCPEPVRPGRALHRQQHRDDPARLWARQLVGATIPGRGRPDGGRHRGRVGHVPKRPPVGLPTAGRHARPAADRSPLLRLHRRRHGPLHHRRPRATGDAVGPGAGPRGQPGGRRLDQPADRVHPRDRHHHGPGQRGCQRGPAATAHREPATGVERRSTRRDRAAYLLRRTQQLLCRGRRPPGGVRLPDGRDRGGRLGRNDDRAGPGRAGSGSTTR